MPSLVGRNVRRLLVCLVLIVSLARGSTARGAYGEHCHSTQECGPWEVCTVQLGECGSGDSPLAVCTGRCVAGRAWRVDLRAGAVATSLADAEARDATFAVGARLGFPFWQGRLALAAEVLTAGLGRVGVVLATPRGERVRGGLRADWIAGADAPTGALGLLLEYAPGWPLPGSNPYVALFVEGGAWIDADDAAPFVAVGLAAWLPPIR
jgi:hypothetical protein